MSTPKLHHFVPRFHLRRFADPSGRLWAWDRQRDRVFRTSPGAIAAENQFYRLTQYEEWGHDGATMENQLADLEGEAALITGQWLDWLREMAPLQTVPIPTQNREIVAAHLALQYMRTADTRDILAGLAELAGEGPLTPDECRRFHTEMIWNEEVVTPLVERFEDAIWMFGLNESATPFVTSDNPIAFRSADNRKWLRSGITSLGTYAVYPLAPDIIMYCHPRDAPWAGKLDRWGDCLSPVEFDDEMVQGENSGQVFMATRFVISSRNDFAREREFAATIGTDIHAPR